MTTVSSNHSVFLRAWTCAKCSANALWMSTACLNLSKMLRQTAFHALTGHMTTHRWQLVDTDDKGEKDPPVNQGGEDRSRKKCWLDRTTDAMRRLVAATAVDQLDCLTTATQSEMRAHMDLAVSPRSTAVVSGANPKAAPDGPMCVCHVRAGGLPNTCPAPQSAHASSPSPERRTPTRLYPRALSGGPESRRQHEPQGHGHWAGRRDRGARPTSPARAGVSDAGLAPSWTSSVCLFNGQRHERDGRPVPSPQSGTTDPTLLALSSHPGLYARSASRRQRPGRTLQRPLAGEGLAAGSLPHPALPDAPVLPLSDGLHHLSHTQADPSGAARARERHTVSVPFRVPHPLARCRGQIWVVRSIDEDGHIHVLNETIRLPTR
jgi:hypothetical protein